MKSKPKKPPPRAMKRGFFAQFDRNGTMRELYTRQVPQLISLLGLETVTYFVAAFGALERVTALNDLSVSNDASRQLRPLAHNRNAHALFLLTIAANNELWKVVKELRKHVQSLVPPNEPIAAWDEVERVYKDWEGLDAFKTVRNSLGHHAGAVEIRDGLKKMKAGQRADIFICDKPVNGETSFPIALEAALKGIRLDHEALSNLAMRILKGAMPLQGGLVGTFAELLRRKGVDFQGER